MIWTLTANPAIDITYQLDHLGLNEVHRVHHIRRRPGGKGLNVARVLAKLGEDVKLTGFVGGLRGQEFLELLDNLGEIRQRMHPQWIEIEGQTRLSITATHDAGMATVMNEAGPTVEPAQWQRLYELVEQNLHAGDVITISGSMPRGSTGKEVGELVKLGRKAGATVVADVSKQALLQAAYAGAALVKPNHLELIEATGCTDLLAGARQLLEHGAGTVCVSRGEDGMILVTRHGVWTAHPHERVIGNTVGAGDASVASWCRALNHLGPVADQYGAERLAQNLADAVALSAAAVAAPVAGDFDRETYLRMKQSIEVEEYHAG